MIFFVLGFFFVGLSELILNLFLFVGNNERDCLLVMLCYSKLEILCVGELFR